MNTLFRQNKLIIVALLLLTLLAAFLRLYLLPSHLFFGPEQGRDMLVVRDIVMNHKMTLIGPRTDIQGVFHGPFYYYLAAVPFAIFQGNPLAISIFFLVLQICALPMLYVLVFEMTKDKRSSFIAALLFVFSFQTIVNARWLTHPPLSIPFAILFFLFLVRFLKGKQWNLVGAAVMYGFLGQIEFTNYALFGVIVAAVFFRYIRVFQKTSILILLFSLFSGGVCAFGTYLLFDVRHNYLITKGILGLIQGGGFYKAFIPAAIDTGTMYLKEIAVTFGFLHIFGAVIAVFLILYGWIKLRKSQELTDIVLLWILMPLILLLAFRHSVLEQILIGLIPGWIVGVSIGVAAIWKRYTILGIALLLLFLTSNIVTYVQCIPKNEHVFFQASQARIRYSDELNVVHAVYKRAAGKPFYFQSFTIPIFLQDGWTYLFWYIGMRTYKYVPIEEDKSIIYVIIPTIHDDPFLGLFQKNWYRETVSTWGNMTYQEKIGEFTVEERKK